MSYATLQDLVTRYGADEMVQLVSRADVDAPDITEALVILAAGGDISGYPQETQDAAQIVADAVEDAIDDARAEIDPHLQARYALPLSSVPRIIKRSAMEIARFVLHGDLVPDVVKERYGNVMTLLRSIMKGDASLALDEADELTPQQGGVQSSGPDRVFTTDNLSDYTG